MRDFITRELLKVASDNPELPIKFMVDSEVVADDFHEWWLAEAQRVEIADIYLGGGLGDRRWGDDCLYVRHKSSNQNRTALIEYIAENQLDLTSLGDCEVYEEAYETAKEIVEKLPWQKVILVYVGV